MRVPSSTPAGTDTGMVRSRMTRVSPLHLVQGSEITRLDAEEVAEDVAKDIAEVAEIRRIEAADAAAGIYPGMAELVIAGALLRIDEYAVSFGALLEFLLRLRVPGVAVRMMLHGELAV